MNKQLQGLNVAMKGLVEIIADEKDFTYSNIKAR